MTFGHGGCAADNLELVSAVAAVWIGQACQGLKV